MKTTRSKGERSIALFLLGLLLFNPPVLSLFKINVEVMGVPLLYLYVFTAWGAFIALMGLIAESGTERRRSSRIPPLTTGGDALSRTPVPQDSLPHRIMPPASSDEEH